MASYKLEKIASDITRVISEAILTKVRSEVVKSITITGCVVSKDLMYAKVYFTSILDIDKKILEKEVNEASSFFRTIIAEKLDLRQTPLLTFIFDESVEYGNKIEKIIKEIHEEN